MTDHDLWMKNLIDDPWLNVRFLDGSTDCVSLLGVFQRAHEIRALETGWSVSDAAVFDYILAIAYRALDTTRGDDAIGGYKRSIERAKHYLQGGLDADGEIAKYLSEYREAFRADTFMQCGYTENDRVADISALSPELNADRGKQAGKIRTGSHRNLGDISRGFGEVMLDLIVTSRMDKTSNGAPRDGGYVRFANDKFPRRKEITDGIEEYEKALSEHQKLVESGDTESKPPAQTHFDSDLDVRAFAADFPDAKGVPQVPNRSSAGVGVGSAPRLVIRGENFAQTVIYNLAPQTQEEKSLDRAAWEHSDWNVVDGRATTPILGSADGLTFQSRSISVIWDDDMATGVVIGANNGGSGAVYGQRNFWETSPIHAWKDDGGKMSGLTERLGGVWSGFRAYFLFTRTNEAGREGAKEKALVHLGRNVPWQNYLMRGGVIGKSDTISVEHFAPMFGNQNANFEGHSFDAFFMRSFLTDGLRSSIGDSITLIDGLTEVIDKADKLSYIALSPSPSSDQKKYGRLVRAKSALAHRLSSELHQNVSAATGLEDAVSFMASFANDARVAALGALDLIENYAPPRELSRTSIPTMMKKSREEVSRMTEVREVSPVGEPAKRVLTAIESKAHSIMFQAKSDPSLRSMLSRAALRDVDSSPMLIRRLGRIDESLDRSHAEKALVIALSIWAATSGSNTSSQGGSPLFSAAKLCREGAAERYVDGALSLSSVERVGRYIDQTARLVVNRKYHVDFARLAQDLYEYQSDPKTVARRWAREFASPVSDKNRKAEK